MTTTSKTKPGEAFEPPLFESGTQTSLNLKLKGFKMSNLSNRGRKPSPRQVNFYLSGSTKEHKALFSYFNAIQTVFKTAALMRVNEARNLARYLANSFGIDYAVEVVGTGYDYSLTVFMGEKDAALEIEQVRTA